MAKIIKVIPPLPETERGQVCNLACDKSGERLLYSNGTNVIWRNTAQLSAGAANETPEQIFTWKGHTRKVTCAAMDPKGNWVVSGDVTGELRLWGAKGDNVEKNKYKLWNGEVKDVSFSGDSGRIVAAGAGAETKAVALVWDTGSKTGEVAGHTKTISSISFRSERPFKIVTGGEDFLVAQHEGPPFKFSKSFTNHTNFVNCVRYSPDSNWFASCASDGKLCLYKGKEGEFEKEFEKPAGAQGSLYQLSWSPDSKFIATAGGDKTVRVWNVESGTQSSEHVIGKNVDDMVLGIVWGSQSLVTAVCFNGAIRTYNVADGVLTPAGVVSGTKAPLNTVAVDPKTGGVFAGGGDGIIGVSVPGTPTKNVNIGKGIRLIVPHGAAKSDGSAWSLSNDDIARKIDAVSAEIQGEVKIGEGVVGAGWFDAEETMLLCACSKNSFHCVGASSLAWSKPNAVERKPTAAATLPGKKLAVAIDKPEGSVGGVQSTQFTINLYDITGAGADGFSKVAELNEHVHEVTALAFDDTGNLLATADTAKNIVIWDVSTSSSPSIKVKGLSQNAKVTSLQWMGSTLVSGSLDANIAIFDVEAGKKKGQIDRAHKGGVNSVSRVSDKQFVSVGLDGFLNFYELA